MRITDKTTANNALYSINSGRLKLDRLNEMIGSGMQVNRPSDDPMGAKKILDIESQMKISDQYISNIKTGQTWLDMAGTSLEGMLDTVMSIKSTASQALGGMNDTVKKNEMLSQLRFFRQQLFDYSTTQVGSQYVLSGFKSDVAPFGQNTVSGDITSGSNAITNIDTTDFYVGMPITGPGIPDNSAITAIPTPGPGGAILISAAATQTTAGASVAFTGKYNGTEDAINIEVNQGVQMTINITGGTLLRGGTPPGSTGVDIVKTLDTLIADITNGNAAGITTANSNLNTATQQVLSQIADVGMRKARLDNAFGSQQRTHSTLSEMHDNLQNIDYSKAAIQLTQQKTAFEAALSATAKITPLSLLDFLR